MKKYIIIVILLLCPFLSSNERPLDNQFYMANVDFNISYDIIRRWEGNYVHHPFDKGGETYGGITKKYNSNWYGWRYVNGDTLQWNDEVPLAEMWVKDFYLDIWVNEGFYSLTNQALANVIFDLRVHTSRKKTISIVNESLKELNIAPIANIDDWVTQLQYIDRYFDYPNAPSNVMKYTDNQFDIERPNLIEELIYNIMSIRRKYYIRIVNRDTTQKVFMRGWMNRIDALI